MAKPASFAAARKDYEYAFANMKCEENAKTWEAKCHPYKDKSQYGLFYYAFKLILYDCALLQPIFDLRFTEFYANNAKLRTLISNYMKNDYFGITQRFAILDRAHNSYSACII